LEYTPEIPLTTRTTVVMVTIPLSLKDS